MSKLLDETLSNAPLEVIGGLADMGTVTNIMTLLDNLNSRFDDKVIEIKEKLCDIADELRTPKEF